MISDIIDVFVRYGISWCVRLTAGLLLLGCGRASADVAPSAATDKRSVLRVSVRDDGLVATYFRPKDDEMRRGLMIVGGSEGGIQSAERLAYRFAESGFATLAVAYFGIEGLPEKLADIPLEYLDGAVSWLARQPCVKPGALL